MAAADAVSCELAAGGDATKRPEHAAQEPLINSIMVEEVPLAGLSSSRTTRQTPNRSCTAPLPEALHFWYSPLRHGNARCQRQVCRHIAYGRGNIRNDVDSHQQAERFNRKARRLHKG